MLRITDRDPFVGDDNRFESETLDLFEENRLEKIGESIPVDIEFHESLFWNILTRW
ncbi:hypothetical protein D3C81_2255240 [compost metagenome]